MRSELYRVFFLSLVTRGANIQLEYFWPRMTSVCVLKLKEQAYNNSAKRKLFADSIRKQNVRQSELLADAIFEDKIADIWPDYSVFMT